MWYKKQVLSSLQNVKQNWISTRLLIPVHIFPKCLDVQIRTVLHPDLSIWTATFYIAVELQDLKWVASSYFVITGVTFMTGLHTINAGMPIFKRYLRSFSCITTMPQSVTCATSRKETQVNFYRFGRNCLLTAGYQLDVSCCFNFPGQFCSFLSMINVNGIDFIGLVLQNLDHQFNLVTDYCV